MAKLFKKDENLPSCHSWLKWVAASNFISWDSSIHSPWVSMTNSRTSSRGLCSWPRLSRQLHLFAMLLSATTLCLMFTAEDYRRTLQMGQEIHVKNDVYVNVLLDELEAQGANISMTGDHIILLCKESSTQECNISMMHGWLYIREWW